MTKLIALTCFILLAGTGQVAKAQNMVSEAPNPDPVKKRWNAEWITSDISLCDNNDLILKFIL